MPWGEKATSGVHISIVPETTMTEILNCTVLLRPVLAEYTSCAAAFVSDVRLPTVLYVNLLVYLAPKPWKPAHSLFIAHGLSSSARWYQQKGTIYAGVFQLLKATIHQIT